MNWTIALNVFRLQIFCRSAENGFNIGRLESKRPLSASPELSRESSSRRRSGRDTDETVLSRLAWRCELACTPDGREGPGCRETDAQDRHHIIAGWVNHAALYAEMTKGQRVTGQVGQQI